MGEGTVRADLDPSALLLEIAGIPRALFQPVHGTVTKQAIKVRKPLMAREIFTVTIFKKAI